MDRAIERAVSCASEAFTTALNAQKKMEATWAGILNLLTNRVVGLEALIQVHERRIWDLEQRLEHTEAVLASWGAESC